MTTIDLSALLPARSPRNIYWNSGDGIAAYGTTYGFPSVFLPDVLDTAINVQKAFIAEEAAATNVLTSVLPNFADLLFELTSWSLSMKTRFTPTFRSRVLTVLVLVLLVAPFRTSFALDLLIEVNEPGCPPGVCSAFDLMIYSDGSVTYSGKAFVNTPGIRRSKIDLMAVKRILDLAQKLGFSASPDNSAQWKQMPYDLSQPCPQGITRKRDKHATGGTTDSVTTGIRGGTPLYSTNPLVKIRSAARVVGGHCGHKDLWPVLKQVFDETNVVRWIGGS